MQGDSASTATPLCRLWMGERSLHWNLWTPPVHSGALPPTVKEEMHEDRELVLGVFFFFFPLFLVAFLFRLFRNSGSHSLNAGQCRASSASFPWRAAQLLRNPSAAMRVFAHTHGDASDWHHTWPYLPHSYWVFTLITHDLIYHIRIGTQLGARMTLYTTFLLGLHFVHTWPDISHSCWHSTGITWPYLSHSYWDLAGASVYAKKYFYTNECNFNQSSLGTQWELFLMFPCSLAWPVCVGDLIV